ncbi:MAG: hypothetical protein GH155_05450 [Spirochaeta sp.]|nr:hypothetical protein [Spirochaeta sp.]
MKGEIKKEYILSLAIIPLGATASLAGLLRPGLYRDSVSLAAQARLIW